MQVDEGLLDVVLDRLDHSDLSEDQKLLVLAVFESEEQFQEALAGTVEMNATRELPSTEAKSGPSAYLSSVTVRGFRGVGPETRLGLHPGPGLTLVVGRNGSGKSTFAEGIEVALTGTTFRWKNKTKDWKGGWRNLHRPSDASIDLELTVDGERGRTTVTRTWAGDDVDASQCTVQRYGQPRELLATLGWGSALATYRPFLSYSELGQTIAGKPSEMYDAIASILGLEQIAVAERRLGQQLKQLNSEAKEVENHLQPLMVELASLDDDRARAAHAALQSRPRRLDEAAALATGVAVVDGSELFDTLRRLVHLEPSADAERVQRAIGELHQAEDAESKLRDTVGEDARLLSELLQSALDHHERHLDQAACPVCGTDDVLDVDWAERTRQQQARLKQTALAAEEAKAQVRRALADAHSLITAPPPWLPSDSVVRTEWAAWAAGADVERPAELADHLEITITALQDACELTRNDAARQLEELDDVWRPMAQRIGAWVKRAEEIAAKREQRSDVKRVYDWIRAAGLDMRNDRLRPLAERSSEIWQQLRQQSNVQLGPVSLAGQATQRHVVLDVTVDGLEGTALGVMSQGELHALALSLFLPRATVPESPFGFLVIDDPVQSMDPAKVDGLARVLSECAAERQVIVFTHDTRLPDAVRRLNLPATTWEVVRSENSVVELRKADDPAKRALEDASAVLRTDDLPSGVASRIVPGLCRSALEAALTELAWRRRLADAIRHVDIEEEIAAARGPYQLAALGFFGDVQRAGDVLTRVNRYGHWAGDVFLACKSAGHAPYSGDLHALIRGTSRLVERISGEA